jgi:Alanine dehydrogenase/PNT, N-terminal domain
MPPLGRQEFFFLKQALAALVQAASSWRHRMRMGIPKEIKLDEYRVGATPASVREYHAHGHEVLVEAGAGTGLGISDDVYCSAGATLIDTAEEVFASADMIIKVKEHIKDHLTRAGASSVEDKMRQACPDLFNVVRGVCNATKHVATDKRHLIPFVSGADSYRAPSFSGVMKSGSILGDKKGGRVIRHDGRGYDLYGSAKGVLQEFKKQFPEHVGICDLTDC